MDSRIEELEKQLHTAQQRAARAKEEKARAEEETRDTTLSEYIEACHDLVFTRFTVETNKKITSKGSITSPAGKRYPPRLEPWEDFLEEQRTILGTLFSTFPAYTEVFRSRHYLRTQDLLAEPVTLIVKYFQDEDNIKAEFDIGGGIAFETRINALDDTTHGSTERPRTPDGKKLRPDQICAYRRDGGDLNGQTIAFIIKHKAPHKLTLPHLRLGLRPMTGRLHQGHRRGGSGQI
ncbi:hypothetical protein C8A00DRAFT_45233 [Chaetomidium leptoderma]|uniref:Uncharacterized protein n=1 Tax=Chaetomidium leptoderma TaxID=669021 RepID=A0AAN6ZVH5_9PEZI|nr:hypothetical protein C8A00DRAFT_45233 [Chaetomidium leptoderma]